MSDQILYSAKISFHLPRGHDKPKGTAVNVIVATKSNGQGDINLAIRERFAKMETWKDDGQHTYTYALDVLPVGLQEINGEMKTTIELEPNKSPVMFDYELALVFDDGDPMTAKTRLTQRRTGVLLDQTDRKFSSWHTLKKQSFMLNGAQSDWGNLLGQP